MPGRTPPARSGFANHDAKASAGTAVMRGASVTGHAGWCHSELGVLGGYRRRVTAIGCAGLGSPGSSSGRPAAGRGQACQTAWTAGASAAACLGPGLLTGLGSLPIWRAARSTFSGLSGRQIRAFGAPGSSGRPFVPAGTRRSCEDRRPRASSPASLTLWSSRSSFRLSAASTS